MNTRLRLHSRATLATALVLCLAPVVAGQASSAGTGGSGAGEKPRLRRPISLADYWRIEGISNPAISPDGRFVAFVRTVPIEDENRSHTSVWLVTTDGRTPPRQLTSSAFSASAPSWSSDGELLSFRSSRTDGESGERQSVWFLHMDGPGGEAFHIDGVDSAPIFSPDGKWIAFIRETPAQNERLARVLSEFERKIEERFEGREE